MQTDKKISILGCGWLGLPLAKMLLQKAYSVKGSTTSPDKLNILSSAGITPYLIHLNGESTNKLADFLQTDLLIICFPPKIRAGKGEEYVQQIKFLVDSIRIAPLKNILFVSSTSVYPDTNSTFTELNSPADSPTAHYLVQAEEALQQIGIPTTILRFSGLVGYDRHPGRFFAGKNNLPNPLGPVNLIHLDDCLQIIDAIIGQEKWNEVYNACADYHPQRQEFYTAATKALGLPLPHFAHPKPDDTNKIISNEKLKKDLNYRFIYPDPMFFKEVIFST